MLNRTKKTPAFSKITAKDLLLGGIQSIALLCVAIQLAIDSDIQNILCVALTVASTSLLVQYLWRSEAMISQPLSSFALLGFTASSQFIALAAQSFSGNAFTQSLRAPLLTFSVLAIVHVVAIIAHWVFRHFKPLQDTSNFISEKIYGPLGVHSIPEPTTLWLLSIIGLASIFFGGGDFGDAGGKFIAAFYFLMWTPFLIPLFQSVKLGNYCDLHKHMPFIALYALLVVGIAIAKNFRAMIFIGPLQLLFVYLIYKCRTNDFLPIKHLKIFVILSILSALTLPILSDAMIAMEIARANRGKISAGEMLKDTYEAFLDTQKIEAYRATASLNASIALYDEQYINNPMMNRLSETKFHDNMIYFGSRFSENEIDAIIRNDFDKTLAIIPQNIIDLLDLKIKKSDYVYSNGDFYNNLHNGSNLGGFATGSVWADLYVITGMWLPFFIFIFLMVVFIPMDALSRFAPNAFISPAALCTTWHLYLYGIGGESIYFKLNQIFRNNTQTILLYALSLFVISVSLRFFKKSL